MPLVLNVADAETHSDSHGEHFAYAMTELASALGAKAIGANITRVPPGKAAFPHHHHFANEEHFFILNGAGVLRVGEERHPVKAQDYIVHPPGGPELAHQLVNTGTEDLVYLAISSCRLPEVVGYPDSGKTGVRPSSFGDDPDKFRVRDADKEGVGYWEGEDGRHVAEILAGRA